MANTPIQVLIVEDNSADWRLLKHLLTADHVDGVTFEAQNVAYLAQALDLLRKTRFDVILLDLMLPDSSELATFESVHNLVPETPIVVLTAMEDESLALKASRQGAQDYLVKRELSGDLLARSIHYAIERERMDQLRREFAGLVAHELRNPLTMIYAHLSEVVAGSFGAVPEAQKAPLSLALRCASRIDRIINNLLEMAKIETGGETREKAPVDIAALAKEVTANLRPQAQAWNLELKDSLPPGPVELALEKEGIAEVFTNLVVNAMNFTPKGTIEVCVRDRGADVECSVGDTGIGIAQKDLPNVFCRFTKFGTAPVHGETPGSGLGLYIVKEIVKRHRGDISVASSPGQGTKFTFVLPKNPA